MIDDREYRFKFSIVIAVYNVEAFLAEAIESLIEQSIGFKENVQVILVNDGSSDNSGMVCDEYQKKYPENIIVVHKENGGVSSARNEGLRYIEGRYVNFMDGDDKLSSNTLALIDKYFQEWTDIKLLAIPLVFFDGKRGKHVLNDKFNKGTRIINLLREYQYPLLSLSSAFITYEIAKTIHFDERLVTAEDAKVIQGILLTTLQYGVVSGATYWYRRRTTGVSSAIQNSTHTREWYVNYIEYFAKWCIDESKRRMGCVPKFIQYTVMYDLQWRYQLEELPLQVLTEKEIQEYLSSLRWLIQNIDDEIILSQKHIFIEHKLFILKQKYGHIPKKFIRNNDIIYFYQDRAVYQLSKNAVKIDFIRVENNNLIIEGSSVFCEIEDTPQINWYLKANDDLILCETMKSQPMTKSLGDTIAYRSRFKATLKLTNSLYNIKILCKINGMFAEKKRFQFGKFSPLQGNMWNSYFTAGDYIISYKYNTLVANRYTIKLHIHKELSYLKGLIKKNTPASKKAAILRTLYRVRKRIPHKQVWLISDRVNKADDNGEALFRYMKEHPDKHIKCYFAISPQSPDFQRLKTYGTVIAFGGWLYKWLYICGAHIISSQAEDYVFRPIQNGTSFYADIVYKSRFVFLQHGVTQNDLSRWLNRENKNIALLATTTNAEYASILKGNYLYDESVVKLTGFARYDRLSHNEMRKITFMPSWRSYLVSTITANSNAPQPLNNFEESAYYKVYSELWNNGILINKAKELGYTLQLMIHPNMVNTLPYFSLDPYIKVLPFNESYNKIFAESDLLVTDYSSVSFDFAYLRKPVLYFQFDKEEIYSGNHTFQKGYFDYEKNGFGEVEYTLDGIIQKILEYMEQGCQVKDSYLERINRTFPFADQNNCKRICEEIKKLFEKQ